LKVTAMSADKLVLTVTRAANPPGLTQGNAANINGGATVTLAEISTAAGLYTGNACTQCTQGKFSAAAASVCTDCPAGKSTVDAWSTGAYDAVADCNQCGDGKYSAGGVACATCANGQYAAAEASVCIACAAGKSATAGSAASCTGCTAGNYAAQSVVYAWQDKTGVGNEGIVTGTCSDADVANDATSIVLTAAITNLDVNEYIKVDISLEYLKVTALSTDKKTLTVTRNTAPTGLTSAGAAAIPAGVKVTIAEQTTTTYGVASTVASCTQCGAGTYSAAEASTCTKCPVGKSAPAGSDAVADCTNCTAGMSADGTACANCPAGQYAAAGEACTACLAGKYLPTTVAQSSRDGAADCVACPVGTYADTTSNSAITDCKMCLDAEVTLPQAAGWGNPSSWANYTTYVFGNYAPTGSDSSSDCQNTKSVCPNVPLFAEMTSRPTTCAPTCSASSLIHMDFDAQLYITASEFTADVKTKYVDAVQEALGAAVSKADITIVSTSTVAQARARKSETVTVATRVQLTACPTSPLTFAQLQTSLLAKGVSSQVPSAYYPWPTTHQFPASLFIDKGALLDLEIKSYTDKSADVLTESTAQHFVKMELTFSKELSTAEIADLKNAMAKLAGNIPSSNVIVTKVPARRAAVKYEVKILVKDAATATAVASQATEAAVKQAIVEQNPALGAAVSGVGAAQAATSSGAAATTTPAPGALSAAHRSLTPGLATQLVSAFLTVIATVMLMQKSEW
jgi:hypothetical protein